MTNGVINIVIGEPLVPWWELCCTQSPTGKDIFIVEEEP